MPGEFNQPSVEVSFQKDRGSLLAGISGQGAVLLSPSKSKAFVSALRSLHFIFPVSMVSGWGPVNFFPSVFDLKVKGYSKAVWVLGVSTCFFKYHVAVMMNRGMIRGPLSSQHSSREEPPAGSA